MMSNKTFTRIGAALLAVLVPAWSSCGSGHPRTVPVGGRITFLGGDWPAPGLIYFTVVEPAEGFPRHPGIAEFDRSGRFAARTWDPGDGLLPGKYKVHIECWQTPPQMEGPPPVSHVPEKYQSGHTSDLVLDVQPDSRGEDVLWDISPADP